MLLNCACILVRVLEKKQDFITSYFIVSLCIGMAMALALALSVLALLTSLRCRIVYIVSIVQNRHRRRWLQAIVAVVHGHYQDQSFSEMT